MRWFRLSFYCLPLLLVALAHFCLASLGHQEQAAADSITFAITAEPLGIDPLTEQDPISEEIESLLFDTLIGRDPRMRIEGRLAESWNFTSRLRLFCISERFAAQAWAEVEKSRPQWPGWGIVGASLVRDEIRVDFHHHEEATGPRHILGLIPPELHAPVNVWRIHTGQFPVESFENFRKQAVEGWQARRTWSGEDGFVEVCSAGNEANFERELRLYYQSNPQLNARLEKQPVLPYLHEPAMTMFLRPGVRWHDGRPVTTEDVIHSIGLARESRNQPALTSALRSILSVEPEGPLAFKVTYRQRFAPALEVWEQIRVLPKHAWHAYAPQLPQLRPTGTGPFTIREWLPGGPIVLERFPGYFRNPPENQHIVYQRVLENRLRRILFEIEAIDSYEAQPAAYKSLKENPDFELVRGPATLHTYVAWNLDHEPFRDPGVRQALAQAIDARQLSNELLAGQGQPVNRLFHPHAAFAPGPLPTVIGCDPSAARKALARAGYENRLRFTLTVVAGDDSQREIARFLQRQWRRIGVIVQLRLLPHGKMSGIRSGNTGFEAALLVDPLPHQIDQFSRWHASEIGAGLGNFNRLRDPGIDRLLEQIRTAYQPAEQRRLAAELQSQLYQLHPCLHLALRDTARVFHPGRAEVVDKGRTAGGEERRPIGSSLLSLTHDLAWWVERPLPPASPAP
ncbi:MAG: ABC-type transport system, substrate-binding protein [Verrucomicrobia bacterium]|nr:MAG: ABC-type transport system, substrate-binding protein [Verrucomicrobiota bacterium]